jgi:hypothetical protein
MLNSSVSLAPTASIQLDAQLRSIQVGGALARSPRDGKMHCGGNDQDHEEIKNLHVGQTSSGALSGPCSSPAFSGMASRQ